MKITHAFWQKNVQSFMSMYKDAYGRLETSSGVSNANIFHAVFASFSDHQHVKMFLFTFFNFTYVKVVQTALRSMLTSDRPLTYRSEGSRYKHFLLLRQIAI